MSRLDDARARVERKRREYRRKEDRVREDRMRWQDQRHEERMRRIPQTVIVKSSQSRSYGRRLLFPAVGLAVLLALAFLLSH